MSEVQIVASILEKTAQKTANRSGRRMKRSLYPKDFGRRVRLLREDKDWSQQDLLDALAKRHGISFTQSYLSKLEKSRLQVPGGRIVLALAVELETTTDFLLCRVDDPDIPDGNEPATVAYSEEGEEAAKIIDALSVGTRKDALGILKSMYEAEASRRTRNAAEWKRLLTLIENVAGVSTRDQVEQALLANSLEITSNNIPK